MMYKSDTFHNEDFQKQIAKPFNKKSVQTKNSSTTLDPSLKESTKSLKESFDFETNFKTYNVDE